MPSADDPTDRAVKRATATDGFVVTFDPLRERPSTAVVSGVASLLETDPLELEPIYEGVEPTALDSFVEHAQRTGVDGVHELWFTYEGFDVGVQTDGRIVIREATDDPASVDWSDDE
ncbi:HalOD1 output domain-containing protein [Natrarchaeobaculum aegyptiacum]|uniref:Halobacterial output domain-containing protein n=1 Tax=Natrarchaeobaculum aegyptiacum TaxID=745377 RepID=A0A2Z2HXI5_9EURY|nr:HalOD1 output domain-containing protein [Natrarchaeobaculum aegyptiacum]ARS89684.1 hypothetical protein B1756_07975 [Natrarchaeobaculum aegyptiacum]